MLANEQVIDGACERCGTQVEQRFLEQWFFRISEYSERLLNNLERIDWSESTKTAQRNWIGRVEGAEIVFSGIGNGNRDRRVPRHCRFPIPDSRFPSHHGLHHPT